MKHIHCSTSISCFLRHQFLLFKTYYDNDWVQKCMEYEVEGARTRGRPKRTWREVVHKDCQAHKLNGVCYGSQ